MAAQTHEGLPSDNVRTMLSTALLCGRSPQDTRPTTRLDHQRWYLQNLHDSYFTNELV